ncbi:ribonuclease H-like domain-containing protein [Tanacetum coccineum]
MNVERSRKAWDCQVRAWRIGNGLKTTKEEVKTLSRGELYQKTDHALYIIRDIRLDTLPILLSFTHCGNKSILRVLRIILVILPEHPSETKVFHNEDGNLARANIKQALGRHLRVSGVKLFMPRHGRRNLNRSLGNAFVIEFDAFGFSVKDFLTRHILLRCDSSGDLYPVTQPSITPQAFLSVSPTTWHQRLGHPGEDVLRSLISRQFISCNKETSPHICHACQLGKHVRLPFSSSDSIVTRCFEIIHSDIWTSPIISPGMFLSQRKYAMELLERAHMANCNSTRTPADTKSKLGSDREPVSDPTLYRSLAGGLQYLIFTRPDISYVGTLDFGLQLYSSPSSSLVAYTDADWEGCPTTQRSTSRYCRMKHIEIDIHFVRDMVARGHVRVLRVLSRYQYADIFTKGLPSALFEEFRTGLCVRPSPPARTAGEC